jgi:hypothetical protein
MSRWFRGVGLVVAMALVGSSANAGPPALRPLPGKKATVTPAKLKALAKAPKDGPLFDIPTAADAGRIVFFDTANDDFRFDIELPLAGWRGLANPPGSGGFKFKLDGNLCRVVVKPNKVKASCKTEIDDPLALPVEGLLGVVLDFGFRYCMLFGGETIRNDASKLIRKDAGAPPGCPSPGPPPA